MGQELELGACGEEFAFQLRLGDPGCPCQDRHQIPPRSQPNLVPSVRLAKQALGRIPANGAGEAALDAEADSRDGQMIWKGADGKRAFANPRPSSTDLEKPFGQAKPFAGIQRGAIMQRSAASGLFADDASGRSVRRACSCASKIHGRACVSD